MPFSDSRFSGEGGGVVLGGREKGVLAVPENRDEAADHTDRRIQLSCVEVSFRINPTPTKARGDDRIGKKKVRRFDSKYIGCRMDGILGFVFPQTVILERMLDQKRAASEEPWILPVFIKPAQEGNAFLAYYANDKELSPELIARLERLEAQVHAQGKILQRLRQAAAKEGIMILVDYQYLSRALVEEKISPCVELEDIVGLICNWGCPRRRNEFIGSEKQVFIYEHRNPQHVDLYETWKNRGFNFQEIRNSQDGKNHTDEIMMQSALEELDKKKDQVDVVALITGDMHFYKFMLEVKRRGKEILLAYFPRSTAREMYISANIPCDLSLALKKN